ncbi:MAG TPA: bifunctional phosphoribosylaminoimidazolecarboxamide formyltransferase/IMP cyclohydrolase [Limnochordia bacterium]|nr:bifunctional phosphoribosylaminoimidazolecarboxamide formyltransferase/IMP cyclohydrolase [Limnochordia bacterium]
MARRALISVSNKEGLLKFARELVDLGFELLSTGGTAKALREANLPVIDVESVTEFPEILDGRVKTLHPKIHGGMLAKLDEPDHQDTLKTYDICPIELVCVNLYPFQATIARPNCTVPEAIENIDIGGPAMLRSAAKNHDHVTVVVEPDDYGLVVEELRNGGVCNEVRRQLAAKVFRHTAAYDALVAGYLTNLVGEEFPERLTLTYELEQNLRYGENPQQRAAFYRAPLAPAHSLVRAQQLQGKELSYNNINDAASALELVAEFSEPAAVAMKHMNPCGVGLGATIEEAFSRAFASDPVSIFGGIVALNRPVDAAAAKMLHQVFLEIIIAPAFTREALEILADKKNLRLLTLPMTEVGQGSLRYVSVLGGILAQTMDDGQLDEEALQVVTKRAPSQNELLALTFGWKVCKHVKSNAIVVSGAEMTFGIGAGQMNRVGAADIALRQAKTQAVGAILASDAFFPMDDTVELAARAGITAIIQPGGSIRDQDSIDKADHYGIAMVFTGVRHFKH